MWDVNKDGHMNKRTSSCFALRKYFQNRRKSYFICPSGMPTENQQDYWHHGNRSYLNDNIIWCKLINYCFKEN